jgi:hypothetical protein
MECMAKMRNRYRILVGKPKGKRPLGRRRQASNIKMCIRELGSRGGNGFIWLRIGSRGELQ